MSSSRSRLARPVTVHGDLSFQNVQREPKLVCKISSIETQRDRAISVQSGNGTLRDPNQGDTDLPHFTAEDANLLKNSKLSSDVIPRFMRKILDLGCSDKPDDLTYLEYLRQLNLSNKDLKSKYNMNKTHIKLIALEKTSHKFDVTIMYSLIRAACKGVADIYDDIWREDHDDSRFEVCLKKIKNLRNDIAHNITTTTLSSDTPKIVEEALIKLMKRTAELYSVSDDALQTEIDNITKSIEKIKDMALAPNEKRLRQIQRKVHQDGKREMCQRLKKVNNVASIFNNKKKVELQSVFYPIKLSLQNYGNNSTSFQNALSRISYMTLLDWLPESDDAPIALIVEGPSGSGKSVLLETIAQAFFEIIPNKFNTLEDFDIVFIFKCHQRNILNIGDYLNLHTPKTVRSVGIDDYKDAILESRTLFLVDGFDECNATSKEFIFSVLERYNTSAKTKFIFTARPNALTELKEVLQSEGINYQVCAIEPISLKNDQIDFVKTYAKAFTGVDAEDIVDTFIKFPNNLSQLFQYPINIALYCHIYLESTDIVKSWDCEYNILEATYKLFCKVVSQRLKNTSFTVSNLNTIIDKLMNELCILAVKCLHEDHIVLDEESYQQFKDKCYDDINPNIPYDDVLSTFLIKSSSEDGYSNLQYEFYHKSLVEYLASKAIVKKDRNGKDKSISSLLADLLDQESSKIVLSKFQNPLRFMIINLSRSLRYQHSEKRIKEITQIFRDCQETSFTYWNSLVSETAFDPVVTEQVSNAMESEKVWVVTENEIKSTIHLLERKHPLDLRINFQSSCPSFGDLQAFFKTLVQVSFRGSLHVGFFNSFFEYWPCDEYISLLVNSSSTFSQTMVRFVGCLQQQPGKQLAPLLCSQSWVDIALLDLTHDLGLLSSKRLQVLTVKVDCRMLPSIVLPEDSLPLPYAGFVSVCLDNLNTEGVDSALKAVMFLMPRNYKFDSLQLDSCHLTDCEVTDLRRRLTDAGIQVSSDQGISKLKEEWGIAIPGWTSKAWAVKEAYEDGSRNIRL